MNTNIPNSPLEWASIEPVISDPTATPTTRKVHATLEGAIRIARAIEQIIEEYGAHCALTGGCLYTGHSNKDVDIMIYPHKVKLGYGRGAILKALFEAGAIVAAPVDSVLPVNRTLSDLINAGVLECSSGNTYLDKDVEIVQWNRADLAGTRVDLIFMTA